MTWPEPQQNANAHTHTHIYTCTGRVDVAHMYSYNLQHTHTHRGTHTGAHTHMHTRTHTHTHTHTHITHTHTCIRNSTKIQMHPSFRLCALCQQNWTPDREPDHSNEWAANLLTPPQQYFDVSFGNSRTSIFNTKYKTRNKRPLTQSKDYRDKFFGN